MTSALVTGITGQDGLYLGELLQQRGYQVIGVARDRESAIAKLSATPLSGIEVTEWDLADQDVIINLLSHYKPAEIYNFAAYSSGVGMYDDPVGMGEVNGLAVVRILEAVRKVNGNIRFCQASSREIFGVAMESPQTEATPLNPRSPYGAAKLYADAMIKIYREHFGLFACSAILFNHESPRRGLGFVTRKITHGAAQIKLGLASELRVGNLDARRDWGFAGDTVRAMWLMLQHSEAGDYIVATGESHSVRELCECAFGCLGLNYRDYIKEDTSSFRLAEPFPLVGDAGKARATLGWRPEVCFEELIKMMVAADMRQLGAN